MLKTRDGIYLSVQVWAVPHAKSFVIVHHGWSEHSGQFRWLVECFNSAGYTVVTFDCRGHGQSGGQRGHASLQALRNDLDLLLAAVRRCYPGERIFAYGHSMGGALVLHWALHRPEGLSGVIAASPFIRLAFQPPAWKVWLGLLLSKSKASSRFALKEKIRFEDLSRDAAVVEALRKDKLMHRKLSAALFSALKQVSEEIMSHAAEFRLPLLLLHGTADKVTEWHATKEFADRVSFQDKEFMPVEGAYHQLHNETEPCQKSVLEDVVRWLHRHV